MFRLIQRRVRRAETAKGDNQGQHAGGSDTRTFSYSQGRFWSMVIIGGGVFLSFACVLSDWRMVLTQGRTSGDLKSYLILEAICIALYVFLGVFVVKLPPLFLAAGVVALDTRRRRAERITTSLDGISFDDGKRHVAVAWNEVTGHFIRSSPMTQLPFMREAALSSSLGRAGRWIIAVETAHGSFHYSLCIEDAGQLCRTIEERAMPLQKRGPAAEASPFSSPKTGPPFLNSAP